jgi:hypothetical protein
MIVNRWYKLILIAAVAALAVQVPDAAQAITSITDVRVSAGSHDAEESSLGVVSLTDTVLDLGGVNRLVGLRFANVQVPKNAPITRAYIEFTAAGADSADVTFQIEAEAEESTTVFTASPGNISARSVLPIKVDWPVTYAWTGADQVHQTAELKTILQSLVQRSGWNAGNAMTFFISGTTDVYRRVRSWNADPDKAPKLHVEFSANVIDVPIASGGDDMHQRAPAGTVGNGNSFMLGYSGLDIYYGGLRFQNVNIPQGAVINYACLRVVAYDNIAPQGGHIYVRGEKRTNPPAFSTTATSADAVAKRMSSSFVPKTSAYVSWGSVPDWTAGQVYTSPDLKTVIQEIVGQTGWDTSDKSLVLLTGPKDGIFDRSIWSYNGDPAKAAVLHVEYGDGGGGASISGVPVMTLGTTDVGRTAFQGATPAIFRFPLINSGAGNLNYTTSVIYNSGSGWLSLSPSVISGSLQPGEEQGYAVNFDTTALDPGTYEAKIRFADPAAPNSPQEVRVSLAVLPQEEIKSDDVPIYTQGVANPAVLVLLDCSGSMSENVDLFNMDDITTRSPDLKHIIQEIISYDAWPQFGGSAIALFVERVSGTGLRTARAFDGNSASAPHLFVEYVIDGVEKKLVVQVVKSQDDGHHDPARIFEPFPTRDINLPIAYSGSGAGVGMVFSYFPVPRGAIITSAYLQFVPALTDSAPIRVRITGEKSAWVPSFNDMAEELLLRPRTSAAVEWDIPPWTGVTVQTRNTVAHAVISELFKDRTISWGFGTWTNDVPWWNMVADHTDTIIDVGCHPHTEAHQARLQSAVAYAGGGGYTPLLGSLKAAKLYFTGQKKDYNPDKQNQLDGLEDGAYYSGAACQPAFVIEVTDGLGNAPSWTEANLSSPDHYKDWYTNQVRVKVNELADNRISTVGIGFGLPEWESYQLYALADQANQRGKASENDDVYALHKVDEEGRALPYLAFNKNQLSRAFRDIVSQIKGTVYYGSAPAATTSTDLGDRVLVASFVGRQWTGELEAITKNSSGQWTASVWKATEQMPNVRSVWTADAGGQVAAYTDGTLSNDNYLCKPLGDIINSTPVVVGTPPFFYTFDGYPAFKRQYGTSAPRERLVYVGANDGLLHAFSLADGKEKWAFLPHHLQGRLNQIGNMCATGAFHKYLLDGTPQLADVYAKFGGGTDKWRTLLVIGQRQGGTYYSALDVTSGQSPDPGNSDPAKPLWEFTDSDLGESWADAAIERVADANGPTGASSWGVFLSSGYAEVDNLQADKEAYLFGLQADTGAPLWTYGSTPVHKVRLFSETGTLGYSNLSGGPFAVGEVVQGATSGASGRVAAVTPSGALTGTLELNGNAQNTDFQNGRGS